MALNYGIPGKWSIAALGAAALALPLAGALATPVDPTQAPAAEELTAEQLAEGRTLFQNWSCGACHALSHGGGFGQIGPSLDGNTGLDKAYIINRTTNGQGAMPSFGGQMTDAEIELLAAYIMQVKR